MTCRRSRRPAWHAAALACAPSLTLLITLALAAPAAAATEPPLRDADYLAFADRVVTGIRATWDVGDGVYTTRHMGATARTNANLLLVHATAARIGHTGAARQDARARALVTQLTTAPMYDFSRSRAWTGRTVCWSKQLTRSGRDHVSLDSQIAEALAAAWQARAALGLPAAQAARIAAIVDRCARHPAWRFPRILKNQFNWNAQLYAAAELVTGHGDLLRRDYRRHLHRFATAAATNLGSGSGFHYHPELPRLGAAQLRLARVRAHRRERAPVPPARAGGGHGAPAAARHGTAARWVTRLLLGSWTHAGYLNWDTGLRRRPLALRAVLGVRAAGAARDRRAPAFWARPEYGRWAKALFDRGLLLYARWGERGGRRDRAASCRSTSSPSTATTTCTPAGWPRTRCARSALGLGARPAADPPPLYAFDRETGRLAVTTPRYSTAIVPDNRGAFAYGGIELARLYGAGQRVAATTGGRPPSAFGVVIRDAAGRALLASQGGRSRTRLRLLDRDAPSGPFRQLRATGTIARAGLRITTTHRFDADGIAVRWDIRCRGGCAGREIEVQLPTWGEDAVIASQLAGPLTGPTPFAATDRLQLGAGYAVTPIRVPAGAMLLPLRTAPQPTAPHPGPTLAVRLEPGTASATTLAVRIEP